MTSQNASHVRLPPATPTDGRTDGRTNEESWSPSRDTPSSVTRTRTYGDLTFIQVLEEAIDALEAAGTRLGSPRTEQRDEIHPWTRRAIYWRDRNQCAWCQRGFDTAGMLVLDHITPWAAGGSDRSDNLRTLCVPCNDERSNYATDTYTRVLPVGLCDRCAGRATPTRRAHYIDPESTFRQPIFCGNCGTVRDCTDRKRVL